MAYIVKPKADWADDDSPIYHDITIYEDGPVDTGLFDSRGNRLFRVPDPIGFQFKRTE